MPFYSLSIFIPRHFQTPMVVIGDLLWFIVLFQALIIISAFLWCALISALYFYDQGLQRHHNRQGALMPQPTRFKRLRNYIRGDDAYYSQNNKNDQIALSRQTFKRLLFLLSPMVIGILMLKFPAYAIF